MKKLTVSASSFEDLRTKGDYIYVDKTKYVYNLVKDELKNYYFISRPRRYGKSLMCSTLHALFEGKRELFKGLYIDSTDYSFEKFPVLHFNFADINTKTYDTFLRILQNRIIEEANNNDISLERDEPSEMLYSLLGKLKKTAVIIVDEYDYTIIHTYKNLELADKIRDTLSSFYTVIKNTGEKVRFFFITGITKFSNMSIFSQMNNLTDLTFNKDFATAFGYTEEELESNFSEYIDAYMNKPNREYENREDFIEAIRNYYDGYRFSYENEAKVYNPVSVGFFFNEDYSFKNYWNDTGESTLVVDLAKTYHLGNIIAEDLTLGVDIISTFDYGNLASNSLNASQVLALIYFTGYLTIKEGNNDTLILTFPNKEVRTAFTKSLLKLYAGGADISVYIAKAKIALATNNITELVNDLNAYYEKLPYTILSKEIGYQSMFYAFFVLLGIEVSAEDATAQGRIDVTIETKTDVFIIEIKVNQSALKALKQIHEKKYYSKYINSNKCIHIVGLNFASRSHKITSWKEEIIDKTKEPTYLGPTCS